MEYYAVRRSDTSDELTHWKYIKREKVNGKWKYIYDDSSSEVNKAKKNVDEKQKELDDHFDEYWQKSYESELARLSKKQKRDPERVEKIKNKYESEAMKEATKSAYSEGKQLRLDAIKAQNTYDIKKNSLEGKVDSTIIKAEKWVHEKVLSSKVGDVAADVIGRGEEKLNSLLGKVKKKRKTMTKEFDTSRITKTKRSS